MKKILVWMSWWVDSAVSLYLLKQQGYEVAAWFMKNYSTELPWCTTREDRDMAIKVSQYLWVDTFIINDFRKQFNEKVLDYMYEEYKNWRTPNPDIFCNVDIKCSLFLSKAIDMWFDWIAMWHYANTQIVWENCYLSRGADIIKDQSFFLCRVDRENLKKIIFPVWWLLKSEVREIADKLNLPNSKRKDSQWICFVWQVWIKEFLKNKIEPKKWNIIDENW
jgi:tRNA-specific 2-thiouridylase